VRSLAEPILAAQNLACGFCEPLISGLDLTLSAGDAMAVLGPNAAGKTTLLRTLLGIVPPLAGVVRLAGRPVGEWPDQERAKQAAYVPQELSSPEGYTVAEAVALGRYVWLPETSRTTAEKVTEALARADATHLANRRLTELSGGEKRRVSIARALAQCAHVLVLDEPNAHLDFRHQAELAELLTRLRGEGMALLVAAHDLDWAARLSPRALVLADGRADLFDSLDAANDAGALAHAYGRSVVSVTDARGQARWLPER